MGKRIGGSIRRLLAMILLFGAFVVPAQGVLAQDSTPAPAPDSDAGSLVIEAVQSPSDNPRVEFHVTSDAPWPVGDGFAAAAFDFTLSGPNGDQPVQTSDQAPGGLTTINVLAGDYTLTDNDSGESASFTITAGQSTYVSVARFYVSNPEPPATAATTPVAAGGQTTTLPTTGSGPAATGVASTGLVLFLMGLAGLTGLAALARFRQRR